jgi:tRNA threonylcarbamoyladenosine biosynthesis protein TsaB
MRLLAIETSTAAASVAVIEWEGEWNGESDGPAPAGRVRVMPLKPGQPQTETLLETIDQLLVECGHSVRELDGFAAAIGPGAFIGVRVGIATVKGLAMGVGKPVVPVSTLEGLAFRALEPESSAEVSLENMTRLTICPMIDARRGEVYAACYRPGLEGMNLIRQGEAILTSPADLLDRLSGPVFFLGDGACLHRGEIVDRLGPRALFPPVARPELMEPSAAAVARLAVRGWGEGRTVDAGELTAVYLRPAVEPAAVAGIARRHAQGRS